MPGDFENPATSGNADAERQAMLIKNIQYLREMRLAFVEKQLSRNDTTHTSEPASPVAPDTEA
jgi:hypothetical protein